MDDTQKLATMVVRGACRPPQSVQVETTSRRVGWLHRSCAWQMRCECEPWK